MEETTWSIGSKKRIALIAHDHKKKDLLEWAKFNRDALAQHIVVGTGTTGKLLEQTLEMEVVKLQSGPLGGDQQIGARISEGEIDFVIFFWDPLESMPHDVDVKALLRLAVVWNIPIACNRASADFMFSSQLMNEPYERILPDYEAYRERVIAEVDQLESQPALPILPAEDSPELDLGEG
jgi:methylglyoxal synthase